MPRRVAFVALVLAACDSSGPAADAGAPDARPPDTYDDPAAVEARLASTLDELAAFGWKQTGTPEGYAAGDYVKTRLEAAGLDDVHFEELTFPRFVIDGSSVSAAADGVEVALAGHDVFAYGGAGSVSAEVVDVVRGHEEDYAGVDVAGKIVLVKRDPTFHRSSQYEVMVERGGAAMLYVSTSPDNLIQIGTVSDPGWGLGPIPAVTIGADDGDLLYAALGAGQTVTATIDVAAHIEPAVGRNVVGVLPGETPEYLLVGAHYDTWQIGAADNSTGVAAMLEVAEAMASRGPRRLGVVFVGYDGEEQGLFGGYDYLRDHVVAGAEPMLAFVNFEMPSSDATGLKALARTNGGPIHDALEASLADLLYNLYVGMELVAELFGGIIPTDIQGMYWSGLQGLSTASDTPYYHTVEDVPARIDLPFLASAVIRHTRALDLLDAAPIEAFAAHDPEVWRLEVLSGAAPPDLALSVTARDGAGVAVPGAIIRVTVDVDDFTHAHADSAVADENGRATFTVPAAALAAGAGSRWLHVTAGETYPLAEKIIPLD